jgi:hypothetical protein
MRGYATIRWIKVGCLLRETGRKRLEIFFDGCFYPDTGSIDKMDDSKKHVSV